MANEYVTKPENKEFLSWLRNRGKIHAGLQGTTDYAYSGISEYEDDAEYAPSGCVSFLTIHQSKGMEFPIVFVDSLRNVPRKQTNDLMMLTEEKYFKRPAFEPYDKTKYFDFKEIKDVNIKQTFSFTFHITVYETCALQYKFYKELGAPVAAARI